MPGVFQDDVSVYSDIAHASRHESPQSTVDQIKTLSNLSKDGLEDALRAVFLGLLAGLNIHDDDFSQIWNILDTIFLLAKQKDALCDTSLPYSFVEDLLDSQTIEGCSRVFDYLDTRKSYVQPPKGQGLNQVMLRACNELLRRLSRAEDTVLCGRIFIFLFQCIPLGHRSSVNLRGDFHVENVTTYDDLNVRSTEADTDMEMDDVQESGLQSGGSAVEAESAETKKELDALYPKFWSMQSYFASPTELFSPTAMLSFRASIEETLRTFKAVSSSPNASSTTVSTDLDTLPRGTKRKRSSLNGTAHASQTSAFNPKYLTNRDLFSLELHDVEFRRHILVQILIVLDFLLMINSPEKKRLDELANDPSKRPPNTNKNASVLYENFKLAESDKTWIVDTRKDIERLLEDDKLYLRMVNTVLSRDRNWAFWKAIGCPPITRDPVSADLAAESQQTLTTLIANATAPLPLPAGARDLAFLGQHDSTDSLTTRSQPPPTLETYYKSIQTDELDLDFATDEEKKEIHERIAGKLWRALRSVPGRRFRLCEEIRGGENLAALIGGVKEEETDEACIKAEVKVDGDGDGEEAEEEEEEGSRNPIQADRGATPAGEDEEGMVDQSSNDEREQPKENENEDEDEDGKLDEDENEETDEDSSETDEKGEEANADADADERENTDTPMTMTMKEEETE